jgi:integrase
MANTALAPVIVFPTVRKTTPRRLKNEAYRTREHLTEPEVEKLMSVARQSGRYGHRDATAILTCYRLGLRVSELCGLTWRHVNFDEGMVFVERLKKGKSRELPMTGKMIRALRRVRKEWPDGVYVFQNERGAPLSPDGFAKMLERIGPKAGIEHCHPHVLRHSAGYKLANDNVATRTIQDYLGHRSILSTQRYTNLSGTAFRGLWKD